MGYAAGAIVRRVGIRKPESFYSGFLWVLVAGAWGIGRVSQSLLVYSRHKKNQNLTVLAFYVFWLREPGVLESEPIIIGL